MDKRINPWALKIFPYTTILEVVGMTAICVIVIVGSIFLRESNQTARYIEFLQSCIEIAPVLIRAAAYSLAVYCIYGLLDLSPRMETAWYAYIAWILVRSLCRILEGALIYCRETGAQALVTNLEMLDVFTEFAGHALQTMAFYIVLRVFADNLNVFGENEKAAWCRKLAKIYLVLEIFVAIISILYLIFDKPGGLQAEELVLTGPGIALFGGMFLSIVLLLITQIMLFFVLRKSCRMLYSAITYRTGVRGGAS